MKERVKPSVRAADAERAFRVETLRLSPRERAIVVGALRRLVGGTIEFRPMRAEGLEYAAQLLEGP